MNKYKIIDLARLALFTALLVFGVGYALADWTMPTFPPPAGDGSPNAPAPINVGSNAQTRTGPLTIANNLWVTDANLFVNGVDGGVGIGTTVPTASLDVAGQVRIRGGNPISGKVLVSADDSGLATWVAIPGTGITQLDAGTGITFNVNPSTKTGCPGSGTDCRITTSGTISIYDTETQRRISGTCNSASAFRGINQNGIDNTCQQFVTQVTADNGLTATGPGSLPATGGVANIALNLAPQSGLKVNASNQLGIDLSSTGGLGISNNQLMLRSDCASNPLLKWDSATSQWNCAPNPTFPPAAPGGSVMYLKARTTVGACPSGWVAMPTYTEAVGGGATNYVRVCYRTDQVCQVLRLVSISQTTPPPADCPSSFLTASGSLTCGTTSCSQENAPGGGSQNYVRNCYSCY